MKKILLTIILLAAFLIPNAAEAISILQMPKSITAADPGSVRLIRDMSLTWEPNSEPDLSHYIVYWGIESLSYIYNSGNIGLVTVYDKVIPRDPPLYFAVTAVDEAGLESDFSNEKDTVLWADAGADQTVAKGTVVQLNGTNSRVKSKTTVTNTCQWTQTSGPSITINNAETLLASFTVPTIIDGGTVLTFRLELIEHEVGDTDDHSSHSCNVVVMADTLPLPGPPTEISIKSIQ